LTIICSLTFLDLVGAEEDTTGIETQHKLIYLAFISSIIFKD